LDEADDDEAEDTTQLSTGQRGSKKPAVNLLTPSPLPARTISKYKSAPTWLLSQGELRKHSPRLKFEDLSIHLISQGHDPSCVLTIREIDPEHVDKSKKKTSILEDSKTGVLGRIITGLRIKIMKVPLPPTPPLHPDPPMPACAELEQRWNCLRGWRADRLSCGADIDPRLPGARLLHEHPRLPGRVDAPHRRGGRRFGCLQTFRTREPPPPLPSPLICPQAKSLIELIVSICDYVEPTFAYLQQLYSEGADILREETLLAEEAAAEAEENPKPRLERLESIGSSDDSDSEEEKEGSPLGPKPSKQPQSQDKKSPHGKLLPQRVFRPVLPRRRTGMATEVQLSMASLPPGVDNLPVSFPHARIFLGASAALHYLSLILDGDEALEVKGIKYWKERLLGLREDALKVKDDIHSSLDEKRNFFSFILTIVTVGLAPLTILTGYWSPFILCLCDDCLCRGMNFENMEELKPHTYPAVPGVTLLW
jgi:hypothetical protein